MNKLNIKHCNKVLKEATPIDMATMTGLLFFRDEDKDPLIRYAKAIKEAQNVSQAIKELLEDGLKVSPGAEEDLVNNVYENLSAEEKDELVRKRAFLLHFAKALEALCKSFAFPPCIGGRREFASQEFVERLETVFQDLAVCALAHDVEVTFNV